VEVKTARETRTTFLLPHRTPQSSSSNRRRLQSASTASASFRTNPRRFLHVIHETPRSVAPQSREAATEKAGVEGNYNDPERNAFFKVAPEIEHRA